MADFASRPNAPYGQNFNIVNRVGQKQILPGSVSARHISPELPRVGTTFTSGAVSVTAGSWVSFQIRTATSNNATVHAIPDLTIYIDQVDADHAFPYGTQPFSFDTTDWQVIGPHNDWGLSDNHDTLTIWYFRNVSANDHTLYLYGQSRWIASEASGAEGVSS